MFCLKFKRSAAGFGKQKTVVYLFRLVIIITGTDKKNKQKKGKIHQIRCNDTFSLLDFFNIQLFSDIKFYFQIQHPPVAYDTAPYKAVHEDDQQIYDYNY